MDRLLALALQEYEDGMCSGCGQSLKYSMDPDLREDWDTFPPHRCGSCTVLAEAAERNQKREHPHALRYLVGLRDGWQERKAASVAARAAKQNP